MKFFTIKSRDKYAIFGVMYGTLFPLFSTLFVVQAHFSSYSIAHFIYSQIHTPLLWVIDIIPAFVGLFAASNGVFYAEIPRLETMLQSFKNKNTINKKHLDRIQHVAHIGDWDWRPKTNTTYWSAEVYKILGYKTGQIEPSQEKLLEAIPQQEREFVRRSLYRNLRSQKPWSIEHKIKRKDGNIRIVRQEANFFTTDDDDIIASGMIYDITNITRMEKEIKKLALFDNLTTLPKRSLFAHYVRQAIKKYYRDKTPFALLSININNFKVINNTFGYGIGDQVLKELANKLANKIRSTEVIARLSPDDSEDMLARLEGDEFIVLAYSAEADTVSKIAGRILETVREPINIHNDIITVTASIGIAYYPQDGADSVSLIKNANAAIQYAKEPNSYHFCNKEYATIVKNKLLIEYALREAPAKNELMMYYQPIINTKTKKIQGCEALVRWQHPTMGFLKPDSFIPIAEESNLICDIGKWILDDTCAQIKKWQKMGMKKLLISANLSSNQLYYHPNITEILKEALEKTKLNPENLVLEFTETAFIDKSKGEILTVIQNLKALGVKIHIDDFGTGYSSLHYLNEFPVDGIKIDRSFIIDINTNTNNRKIVETMLKLAENLGIAVIAEGVETKAQLNILTELGCELIQGYLFKRPIPADEFTDYYNQNKGQIL